MKKTKNTYIEVILKNLQENKKIYILLLIFLLIGIVLGVFFINNSDEAQKNEVSEYINNFTPLNFCIGNIFNNIYDIKNAYSK